jgi:hypothetical protein
MVQAKNRQITSVFPTAGAGDGPPVGFGVKISPVE